MAVRLLVGNSEMDVMVLDVEEAAVVTVTSEVLVTVEVAVTGEFVLVAFTDSSCTDPIVIGACTCMCGGMLLTGSPMFHSPSE